MTEDIRKTVTAKEEEITTVAKRTDIRLKDVECCLRDMSVEETTQDDETEGDELEGAQTQLEEELAALKTSQALLQELLSQLKPGETEKAAGEDGKGNTNVSFGAQNSGFQVGVSHGAISGITFGKPHS